MVGVVGGMAAVILKNLVHFTGQFLTQNFRLDYGNFLYFAYPLIGISLTVLFVRTFVKESLGHGISRILLAISKKNSLLASHHTWSSMISSTLTIGFGGSVGTEAPIVLTGSAIGSNIGRVLNLNYKYRTLLIGCGATAAIAGIFKAPIAAVVFALEVLMLDLTMWSIVPLLISAVTATTLSYFLLGKDVVFSFSLTDFFNLKNMPLYSLLGVFTGFISLYFTRATFFFEDKIGKIKNIYYKLLFGGITLGLLIYFFPPLFGEGYTSLQTIQSGFPLDLANRTLFHQMRYNYWIFLLYLLLILILKIVAMTLTTGSGGVGGIFAPSLFMGGISGYVFAYILNGTGWFDVSYRNFSLVGMAGVMSGVMHAPLTAIFLIAELTGGYTLFLPIMLTSIISYITIYYFEPHSIYTKQLAKRGQLITHHKDRAVLTLMNLNEVIEKDFRTISPDGKLADLIKVISESKRNIFPVVDNDNVLIGIVLLDDVRDIIFKPELYEKIKISELQIKPIEVVDINDEMEVVMRKFGETQAWNLPVLENGKYIGFISKSNILNKYRSILVRFSDE
jgi:CIC family chloride channel protein